MSEASNRTYFPFYRSFWESLSYLPNAERYQCLDAIICYGLERKEPQGGGIVQSFFHLAKPVLDRDWKQYANACKGGRPSKETQSEPNENPNETQAEPDGKPIKDNREKMIYNREWIKEKGEIKDVPPSGTATPSFSEFWKVYPRQERRGDASKAYNLLVKQGESPDVLLSAAKEYSRTMKRQRTKTEFILLGKNFLTNETYRDYLPKSEEALPEGGNPFDKYVGA